jgi:hypothetical protein
MHLRALHVLALAALSLPAAAQLPFNEGFDAGSNVGGWTIGPPMTNPQSGGNPGAWRNGSVDTFAPQVRTTGAGSVFHGNWRAKGVRAVGIDLITVSTQFPADRELTLMLSNDAGTPGNTADDCIVYFLGTRRVPQPGGGWRTFDFAVDAASTTMPQGWLPFGACTDPDTAWNTVLTDVDEVRFFYGDPTFFFIFDIWNVGIDNARISDELPTSTYCVAKPNSQGCAATLTLAGTPSASNPAPFTIGATPVLNNVNGLLFYGFGPNNGSLLGGTLCVASPITRTALQNSGGSPAGVDCTGGYALDFNARIQSGIDPLLVAGEEVFTQYWFRDPSGSFGSALSDAGQFTIQP